MEEVIRNRLIKRKEEEDWPEQTTKRIPRPAADQKRTKKEDPAASSPTSSSMREAVKR